MCDLAVTPPPQPSHAEKEDAQFDFSFNFETPFGKPLALRFHFLVIIRRYVDASFAMKISKPTPVPEPLSQILDFPNELFASIL